MTRKELAGRLHHSLVPLGILGFILFIVDIVATDYTRDINSYSITTVLDAIEAGTYDQLDHHRQKGALLDPRVKERTSFGLQFLELRPFYIHVQNLAERRRANTENNLDTSSVVVKGHGLYRGLSQTNANCTEWMPSSYPGS